MLSQYSELLHSIYNIPTDISNLQKSCDLFVSRFDEVRSALFFLVENRNKSQIQFCDKKMGKFLSSDQGISHVTKHLPTYTSNLIRTMNKRENTFFSALDFVYSDDEQRNNLDASLETEKAVGGFHRVGGGFGIKDQHIGFLGLTFPRGFDPKKFTSNLEHNIWLKHLSQACQLSSIFQQIYDRYARILTALDSLLLGIIIVDKNGHVVVCNEKAEAILGQVARPAIVHGKLRLSSVHQRKLSEQILNEQPESTVEAGYHFGFGTDEEPERYACFSQPVSIKRNEIDHDLSGAVVVLLDTQNTEIKNIDLSANLLGLTRAETETLHGLVQGDTYSIVSEKRNVSLDTTKSHVSSILQKAACERVNQLLLKVAKLDTPFDFS